MLTPFHQATNMKFRAIPKKTRSEVGKLIRSKIDETTTEIQFDGYCFDETLIVNAVIGLLKRAFQDNCPLIGLVIVSCSGRVYEILQKAISWDKLERIKIDRVEMTKQQAAALGAGLTTVIGQNHFKELLMSEVKFAEGAITKLASGLKRNKTLRKLTVSLCKVGDAELAQLVKALESHGSLEELSLSSNNGQQKTLAALGRMLGSSKCRLKELDFSSQGRDWEDGYQFEKLGGLLEILVDCFLKGDHCLSLTRLDLSYNGLYEQDMEQLKLILELSTCKLERLNLVGNYIRNPGLAQLCNAIPKSMISFNVSGNHIYMQGEASNILRVFETHPRLLDDGLYWDSWDSTKMGRKIQYFKDLNACGRVLIANDGGHSPIPLSVWPIVLARANRKLIGGTWSQVKERTLNVIFHLLEGPALIQRKFDTGTSAGNKEGTKKKRTCPEHPTQSYQKYSKPSKVMDLESAILNYDPWFSKPSKVMDVEVADGACNQKILTQIH
jgi:hypothetical protein